jgi:sulfur carrier protein ThiS
VAGEEKPDEVTPATMALLDLLDELEDDDGRQVWMVAGEVELDQWVDRVARARDRLRKLLR